MFSGMAFYYYYNKYTISEPIVEKCIEYIKNSELIEDIELPDDTPLSTTGWLRGDVSEEAGVGLVDFYLNSKGKQVRVIAHAVMNDDGEWMIHGMKVDLEKTLERHEFVMDKGQILVFPLVADQFDNSFNDYWDYANYSPVILLPVAVAGGMWYRNKSVVHIVKQRLKNHPEFQDIVGQAVFMKRKGTISKKYATFQFGVEGSKQKGLMKVQAIKPANEWQFTQVTFVRRGAGSGINFDVNDISK